MMDELKEVKRALNPTEVLLVVDAMTGQEAAGIQKCICTPINEWNFFSTNSPMKEKTFIFMKWLIINNHITDRFLLALV